MTNDPLLYGLMAEFENAEQLLAAVQQARAAGYTKIDAYTPYPVEGLADALGMRHTHISTIVFLGGLAGAVAGYALQYWTMAVDYPVNVGGRPLNSWPMFVPVVFELTILLAALAAVLGMLALNGLPMPYHPVFNVPQFVRASRDRFFLVVDGADAKFDDNATRRFLSGLNPREVSDVFK
jgi:ActD protein